MIVLLPQRMLAWKEARCSQHGFPSIWVLQVQKDGENSAHENSSVVPRSYATPSRYQYQREQAKLRPACKRCSHLSAKAQAGEEKDTWQVLSFQ